MKFKKLLFLIIIATTQYSQLHTSALWSASKFTTAQLWTATKLTTKITATYATCLATQTIYKSFKESFMNCAPQNEDLLLRQMGRQILGSGAALIGDIANYFGNQELEDEGIQAQTENLAKDAQERTKLFFENLDKNFKELTADKKNLIPNIFNLGFSYMLLDGSFNKGISRTLLKCTAGCIAFLPLLKFVRRKVAHKKSSIETAKKMFRNCINVPCTLHELFIEPIAKIEEKISKILDKILN